MNRAINYSETTHRLQSQVLGGRLAEAPLALVVVELAEDIVAVDWSIGGAPAEWPLETSTIEKRVRARLHRVRNLFKALCFGCIGAWGTECRTRSLAVSW